ncbi:MAG: CapA family protein [Clostridia bacterium]|nr:CapA family protein [Clostridia bacterium]
MESIKISILGDVCPTEDYRALWDNGRAFEGISPIIKSSDLSIVNLECPATDFEKPIKKCGPCLKAKPQDVKLLNNSGFSLISLANNHIKDFQQQGVLDTLQACEENGIQFVGAGENKEEASKPTFFEIKGRKIGVISFAEKEFNFATETEAGANIFDVYSSVEEVLECKKQCDFLIVLYHGGIEHYRYPSETLQKKCRLLVRCGANMVICQHSHCIGTYENYNGGYILYGQGNGVYGVRENNKPWNEGLLLNVEITEKTTVNPILLTATKNGVIIAEKEQAEKRLNEFESQSSLLNDKEFLAKEWKSFCVKNGALNRPLFFGKSRVYIKINRILKNKLFKVCTPKKRELITMNLVRCDAWREVITTLLELDVYEK